jgi:hypothetical protein
VCICDREIDDSCPYCNNRKVSPGVNSFKVKYIDSMDEWDYINNYILCNPDEILDTYSKDVWWDCKIYRNFFSVISVLLVNCRKKYTYIFYIIPSEA